MKKNRYLLAGILLALLLYTAMTPTGALRFAVLRHGYPVTAVALVLRETPHKMGLEENQIGFSLENPPVERDTQAELVNWVITKHGPFYVGDYYGWG